MTWTKGKGSFRDSPIRLTSYGLNKEETHQGSLLKDQPSMAKTKRMSIYSLFYETNLLQLRQSEVSTKGFSFKTNLARLG